MRSGTKVRGALLAVDGKPRVGHSLGSVIAYDLLTHYFAEVSQDLPVPSDLPALATRPTPRLTG